MKYDYTIYKLYQDFGSHLTFLFSHLCYREGLRLRVGGKWGGNNTFWAYCGDEKYCMSRPRHRVCTKQKDKQTSNNLKRIIHQ